MIEYACLIADMNIVAESCCVILLVTFSTGDDKSTFIANDGDYYENEEDIRIYTD